MRASSLETKLKLAPLTIWFVPLNISGLVEVLTMEDVLLAGPMVPHQPQIGHQLAGKIFLVKSELFLAKLPRIHLHEISSLILKKGITGFQIQKQYFGFLKFYSFFFFVFQ